MLCVYTLPLITNQGYSIQHYSEMRSHRKMSLNYIQFHWDFIDYNGNGFINCFEISLLTCSDFTFVNVNFDLL